MNKDNTITGRIIHLRKKLAVLKVVAGEDMAALDKVYGFEEEFYNLEKSIYKLVIENRKLRDIIEETPKPKMGITEKLKNEIFRIRQWLVGR